MTTRWDREDCYCDNCIRCRAIDGIPEPLRPPSAKVRRRRMVVMAALLIIGVASCTWAVQPDPKTCRPINSWLAECH